VETCDKVKDEIGATEVTMTTTLVACRSSGPAWKSNPGVTALMFRDPLFQNDINNRDDLHELNSNLVRDARRKSRRSGCGHLHTAFGLDAA